MNIWVVLKLVPDLVDELELDPTSQRLDRTFLRLVPNELDEHALEQALLLREKSGAAISVVAVDTGEIDEALFAALAKGCDRAIKIVGDGLTEGLSSRDQALLLEQVIGPAVPDLILVGAQAVDDLDGSVGAWLAARLGLPYVGYVAGIDASSPTIKVQKEYPGGLIGELEVELPAVIGIQAAEAPPRYLVTSLLMQAMKTRTLEEVDGDRQVLEAQLSLTRMRLPEPAAKAQMITGDLQKIADQMITILQTEGILGAEGGGR